ncbi:ATP-binding protein [Candidatus Venteria ishoeyi]|uniref:ATP-binding protein n=1 Tax=Candidatus Venteria ishoeyi TaxID=1899563 RepID=UPI0025A4CE04|nr:ATP-binding protein [Candidatus Venteria ishoeyi]MDM8546426.1 ATP-binding protein [Candidatus Venteria ishoeyi]
MNWIRYSLNRQLLFSLSAGLILSSLFCLILFAGLYHAQLAEERSSASVAVNLLLQTSLENAMLKQDLDGLRDIVHRLGEQEDVEQVFIVNPRGEIRFASVTGLLGKTIQWPNQTLPQQPHTDFLKTEAGEVLRSINPVHNKAPCIQCHGPLEKKPVNGVLFVDYAAAPIRAKARTTTLLFIGAGIIIISLTLLMLWFFISRMVLKPVQHLAQAGQELAAGNLAARVQVHSDNELGRLSTTFNQMAETLQTKMRELNEQEAFLQGLLDAIPDGIRVLDTEHRIVKVNHAYCKQLGINSETALSRHCYDVYQRAKPCAPTLSTCPLHEINKNSKPIKKLSHYFTKEGTERPVEVFAAPMKIKQAGQSKSLIVESIRDLEKAVQFSHEQKLSAMGQVAAGVAHEIHNPLASIRLALQNTLRLLDAGTCDPPKLSEYLTLLDREIDKCIAVTQRLLKLTTLGGEQRQPVNIESALRETLSLLEYESQERKITMNIQINTPNCRVLAQENDVRMLIMNLVQNAFHAMPQGGKLDIMLERAQQNIQLHIQDTGVGIPPEHLSKIFDPFFSYRADGKAGTGLGLSISQNLAQQYQGLIKVHSRHGEGACFTLILPDAEQLIAI